MFKETEPSGDWPCYLDVKRKWLARGINSEVYRDGDFVLKVYKAGNDILGVTDRKQLLFYQEVTNEASRLAEIEKWSVKLPFPLDTRQVRVNPFPQLKLCNRCGFWEGRVPYVPGINLSWFPYSFFGGDYWRNYFTALNYRVEKSLDVKGVFITPVNIKRLDSSTLVITDLCDDVAALSRGEDYRKLFSGLNSLPR